MSHQSPHVDRGRRRLGPAALRTCPLSSPRSQARARLGPGGYCRRFGNGGPQTCLPAASGVAQRRPSTAIFINTSSRPSRGAKPRGADDKEKAQDPRWLMRRRRVQGGVPREVPMTQAMMTKGARRAPAHAMSSFPLWCKGSKRRREHQAKSSVLVQQDQDRRNGRKEVIVEPKPASPPEPLTGEDQL